MCVAGAQRAPRSIALPATLRQDIPSGVAMHQEDKTEQVLPLLRTLPS